LMTDGRVFCWGNYGQLTGPTPTPDEIAPKAIPGLTGIRALASGDGFSCAVDAANEVLCWGRDDEGQLGNGLYPFATEPHPVVWF
jgi:alpha-tubulin suppressor-like RCC1 family protein